jgi:ATP-dependent helicase/nuclease subunit A
MSALSYTSLSELERCGYRYYLERVIGLTEDRTNLRRGAGEGLEARARGTIVHRLMEMLDFASPRPPSPQQVAGVAKELGLRASEEEREEIARLIEGALRAALAARVAAAGRLRRELPFAFSLSPEAPLITGVIDLLAEEPDGGFLILDYKSDRVGAELDLAAHVERDYGIQRLLYALAALRDGAPKVAIVHWFLERPDDWVAASYVAGERAALQERLSSLLARALGSRFPVSRRPHRGLCLTCPGRASLCSWGDSETLREDPEADPAGAEVPLQRL